MNRLMMLASVLLLSGCVDASVFFPGINQYHPPIQGTAYNVPHRNVTNCMYVYGGIQCTGN